MTAPADRRRAARGTGERAIAERLYDQAVSAARSLPAAPAPPAVWADRALCRRNPEPEEWFGASARPVLRLCDACPVIAECRTWSLAAPERYGTWAGLTGATRARARAEAGLDPIEGEPLPDTPRARAAAARRLLDAGTPLADVAELLGVTYRAAQRIAARTRKDAA